MAYLYGNILSWRRTTSSACSQACVIKVREQPHQMLAPVFRRLERFLLHRMYEGAADAKTWLPNGTASSQDGWQPV